MQRDQAIPARVVVRVLGAAGEPVGAGFVIGPDLVATCAHVVASAVHGDPYDAAPPARRVELDLPLLLEPDGAGPVRVSAEVARWIPIAPEGTGDIAVLRVRDPLPEGARIPPLRRVDQLWDQPFRVLGFPAGMTDGVWATGRFRGQQGTRWFQLQSTAGEQPIVEGFSGSPVWDEQTGAVVGMTVATDVSATTTAYLIPIDLVLGVDPELLPCPYRGLEPFGEEHAAFFFGRDVDIDRLVDAVARQQLVAVAGPSGAGKSSLVRAGLLPRLRAEGVQVAYLRPDPGRPVAEALSAAMAQRAPAADQGEPAAGQRGRRVLVVDQFEELAATNPDAAQELLEQVGGLVRADPQDDAGAVHAVLTLRSATLDDVPKLAGLLGPGTVVLPPMDRAQLRHAIVAPAERAPGLSFEPGLVDRILDDAAAEPGQLSLVESLLTELWTRRDGGYLTLRAYEDAGGVAGVVATHAEAVVAGFDPADADRLRRLLTALAVPDRDGRFVRRPLRWADVPADLRPLVLRLAAGRLVVVERAADGQETIQIAHQALIAHWPRLRDWLTEDRDFLAWREQLDQQRERWEATGRDDGALLRGSALATALDRLPARAADVPAPDVEFVRRSRARQRREVRRWRVVTAVLAVLVIAAGTLSVVAISSRNEVSERLRLANAELIAQSALTTQLGDPVTATALALAAWRADPENTAARTALLRMSMAMRSVDQVFPAVVNQPALNFGSSVDSDTLLVGEGPDRVLLTGARGGTLQQWVLPNMPPGVDTFRVSPDGRFVAGTGGSREVYLWDVANHRGPVLVEPASGRVIPFTMSISPDGTRLSWHKPAPDGVQLVIRDIASNTDVPHGIGTITGDRVTGTWQTADPRVVLELALLDDGLPGRVTARSLVDGTTVADFPPDSVPFDDDKILSCAPDSSSQAVVRSAVTGVELRRIDMLTDQCSRQYLQDRQSGGARYLMEPRWSTRDRDSDAYRITSLSDGRTFDLTVPPSNLAEPGILPLSSRAAIAQAGADRLDVLLPSGNSIMRIPAVADTGGAVPGTPWAVALSDDQRFAVAISGNGYTVLEPGTRNVLGRLDRSMLQDQGEQLELVDRDRFTIRTKAADRWSFVEFALPSLSPINSYVITPPEGAEPADRISIAATADRIALMADGLVGVFDRHNGQLVGAPINLADNPDRRNYFVSTAGVLALRPGPDGHVAVVGPDGLELWNPTTGLQEGVIRLPSQGATGIAVDQTGTRAAVAGLDHSVQVLDFDSQAAATEPFLLPSLGLLKGFTEDGNIAILLELGDAEFGLSIWDPRTGREVGPLRFSAAHDIGSSQTYDGRQLMVYGIDGALPLMLPLTPQGWSEQLCRITNRPFTDAERALIPVGTDVEAPCP